MRLLPILLICPFMTGCLAYGYPSITQTPPVHVIDPDVKAFRVTSGVLSYGPWMTGPVDFQATIQEISIDGGTVPAQHDSHFAYSYFVIPFAGSYGRSIDIRLYRRGYETIVVESESWMAAFGTNIHKTVEWKKAETLEAREKAIDDLNPRFGICPTGVSAFLVDEYVALAAVATDDSTRKKLQEKAERTLGATAFYK